MLFNFAQGKALTTLTVQKAKKYGKTLVYLHQYMNKFEAVNNVSRFTHDLDSLYYRSLELMKNCDITPDKIEFVEMLEDQIIPKIKLIEKNSDTFGLIRGDYQVRNSHYVENRRTPLIFDFDFMSFSWRMVDIANFTSALKFFHTKKEDGSIDAFLDGYEAGRKLSRAEKEALPYFEIAIWISFIAQNLNNEELTSSRMKQYVIEMAFKTLQNFVKEL